MKQSKIKSQKEADAVFEFLVKTTIDTVGCSRNQAELRITALFDSGILNDMNPNIPSAQKKIDEFMKTPINTNQ